MIRLRKSLFTALALICFALPAYAAPEIGQTAPEFTGTDSNGVTHNLSDFRGKKVVLEWTNHGCPFVQKHYGSGNMQELQKQATDNGVVWLTVASSAPGEQGNTTPEEANKLMEEQGAHPTARIMDPSGEIGQLYQAKTTPHMYVIDEQGILQYMGAIDSNSSPNPDTIEGATNYVTAALESLNKGETVAEASTRPYGCAVKYKMF